MDQINLLRNNYYSCSTSNKSTNEEKMVTDWTESFQIYFKYQNQKWKIDQDGGGANIDSRPTTLHKTKLMDDLFK